jgi:protein-glutamine gamma-glutamyltransferase
MSVDADPSDGARVRWLAVSVAIVAWMCHLTTTTLLFPLLIVVATIPPWIGRSPKDLGPPTSVALLLTVFFSLKLYFAPFEPEGLRTLLAFPLAHACGQGLMCWQVAALWSRENRWLQYIPPAGILAAMCWGDVELDTADRRLFTASLLAALTCHAFGMGASFHTVRSIGSRGVLGRRAAIGGVMALFLISTLIASPLVNRFWKRFEEFLNAHLSERGRVAEVGFNTQSHLGTVTVSRSLRSEQTVLRVESQEEPGYLRGAVYDTFEGNSWHSLSRWVMLSATSPGVSRSRVWEPADNEGLFVLTAVPPDDERFDLLVWPEAATADRLMLPIGTDALIATHDRVQIDGAGVVAVVPGNDATLPYRAHRTRVVGPPPTQTDHPEWLHVPPFLGERLRKLADDFCWNGETPRETAERIQTFFRDRFQYSLNTSPSGRGDPLLHFLESTRSGHCEYFATATTILLRMQGIPARYVTGYLVDEYNPRAGNWIARRKDAHAWAEAWLPGEGWVVIESTPSAGRSQPESTVWWLGEWDAMQWLLRKARWEAARDSWAGVTFWAKAFLQTVPGLVISLAFVVWLATRVVWPAACSLWTSVTARRDELAQRLQRVELALSRSGCARGPAETLDQFAERLLRAGPEGVDSRSVVDWLLRYSAARYGGDEETARQLRREPLPRFRKTT